MTIASIILLALLIIAMVALAKWLDGKLPTAEQEEQRAKRDVEEMLKRANEQAAKRPRVRAGKAIY